MATPHATAPTGRPSAPRSTRRRHPPAAVASTTAILCAWAIVTALGEGSEAVTLLVTGALLTVAASEEIARRTDRGRS